MNDNIANISLDLIRIERYIAGLPDENCQQYSIPGRINVQDAFWRIKLLGSAQLTKASSTSLRN